MSPRSAVDEAHEQILTALASGRFSAGTRLPGERTLAVDVGVSRATLRLALDRLADEGRLERASQRGWFVPRTVVGEPPSTLQSFSEMARTRGLRPTASVLHRERRPASLEEAGRLRIAPAAPVLQINRLRGLDRTPVCVDVVVLPLERVRALENVDLTDVSLYEALQEHCGIQVHRSTYSLMASAADTDLAHLLGTATGAPVLVGDEVAYTADGTPVLLGTNRYRGDAYRFETDLFRSPGAASAI